MGHDGVTNRLFDRVGNCLALCARNGFELQRVEDQRAVGRRDDAAVEQPPLLAYRPRIRLVMSLFDRPGVRRRRRVAAGAG